MMKSILIILSCISYSILFSQKKEDSVMFKTISDEILSKGKGYDNLRNLTKNIGHRLSGSQAYENATKWAFDKLKEAGADKVWYQDVMIPVWERGQESLKIKTEKGNWETIKMLSLGNSEGTKGKDLSGEIVLVKSIEEFNKLPEAEVKEKIIFFNYPFRQGFVDTMMGYDDTSPYRRTTPVLIAKKGGKAVVVRSLSTAFDDVPHTGNTKYEEGTEKIPAVAISPSEADKLEKILEKQKVYAKINSNCTMKGERLSHSVIGEITGKKDKDVIVVGGHLDSWDVGEGAQDDGAGIVQSIEILRTFKSLNLNNNHTIRVVCFANEENGTKGGKAYAESVTLKKENHIFALESDGGGYSPRGFSIDQIDAKKKIDLESWKSLFLPYGVYQISKQHPESDIAPLEKLGIPLVGLMVDGSRYFDLHHSVSDNFENVNRRELLLGAVVMGQLIYIVDKNW